MNSIQLSQEAQLHRESYIAVLNGLLTTSASKRKFAQQLGISPQYLSYLLNPYDRTPSPALAQRIVDALPIEINARNNLLDHLLLASERRFQASQEIQQEYAHVDPANSLNFLQQMERSVNFDSKSNQSKGQREILRSSGSDLLAHLSTTQFPLESAQICLWLNDVENTLNVPGNALYYAKKARRSLEQVDRCELPGQVHQSYDELIFNALRCEAVAYHNLKLERSAYDLCCKAESSPIVQRNGKDWLPHLYRDKINAYCRLPRFSIRQVEAWANHGQSLCQQVGHPHAQLWSFMLDRSLIEAYLQYQVPRKAEQLRRKLEGQVDHLPIAGSLHQVSFLRTSALVFWQQGDVDAWQETVLNAWRLAVDADLTHQLYLFRQQYGEKLQSLLEEIQ